MSTNISFNPLAWAIKPFYDKAIAEDELFAKEVREKESRAEKPKSLAECADYILGEAYKWASEHKFDNNCAWAGLPDNELEGLIKHYYDEDDIVIHKIGPNVTAKVARAGGEEKKKDDAAAQPKKEETKKKGKKVVRPKETLDCVNVPMIRPTSERDARNGSREQAKSVVVMDLFAGFDTEDDDDLPEA